VPVGADPGAMGDFNLSKFEISMLVRLNPGGWSELMKAGERAKNFDR
jgi:hypothetical protein